MYVCYHVKPYTYDTEFPLVNWIFEPSQLCSDTAIPHTKPLKNLSASSLSSLFGFQTSAKALKTGTWIYAWFYYLGWGGQSPLGTLKLGLRTVSPLIIVFPTFFLLLPP